MKVGKYLLEKHNFANPEVKARFVDQFGYSDRILESILTDRYPLLLTCHIHDIAIFTGLDIDFIHSLEERGQLSDFEKQTASTPPMGKPFNARPIMATINIKDLVSKDWDKMKDPKAISIQLNLNNDEPIELVPVTPEGIMKYEQAMNRLRRSMDPLNTPFRTSVTDDPEMEALLERIREFSKGKSFKIITPKTLQHGDVVNKDPAEVDYLVTTYPITGIESVKIVKGRELGIDNGDKFVLADKMRTTLDVLGIDTAAPGTQDVSVRIGNKRIAALMEDPEFAKEFHGMTIEAVAKILKDRAFSEKFGEDIHNPDKPLKGTITLPPSALDGIDIYAQPSLRFSDAEVVTELGKESFNPKVEVKEIVDFIRSKGYSQGFTRSVEKILEELSEPELPQRQTGCRGKDLYALGRQGAFRTTVGGNEPITKEVMVPTDLFRELANIAIDNGYPCAEEAFQLLTKNK